MHRRPLPPETFFEGTPPHVRAYIEQLHATIADLHTRIAELETRQAKNSTNSSLPPSSEHPHAKPARPAPKSLRRCGGQPGHCKQQRPLLSSSEQCQHVIPCVPPTCRRCGSTWPSFRIHALKPLSRPRHATRRPRRSGDSEYGFLRIIILSSISAVGTHRSQPADRPIKPSMPGP